jgi:hypothetical protein
MPNATPNYVVANPGQFTCGEFSDLARWTAVVGKIFDYKFL